MNQSIRTVRELARRYAEIAASKQNLRKQNLWKRINNLRPERPVYLVEELPWHEFDNEPGMKCVCEDASLRKIERFFRRCLYRAEYIKDDYVFLPYCQSHVAIHDSGTGISILEHTRKQNDNNNIYSHSYINQLERPEDIEKIKIPEISFDAAKTEKDFACLSEILGDILPVRICGVNLNFQIWDWIARITGPEFIFTSMIEDPDFLHAIMARVTAVYRARLDAYNKLELFDAGHTRVHCSYVYNDELPGEGGRGISQNTWTYGTAQLFGSVSPAMHKEFDIDYVKHLFPEFGLVMYGCCEPLHDRMEMLFDNIPNLRKLSISPWCDCAIAAEKMGGSFVASVKPNPALVGSSHFDRDIIKRDLSQKRDLFAHNSTPCEFILKDISTVNHDPARLTEWAQIAADVFGV